MPNSAPFGLLLALLAGLSTGIGSAIAYFISKPKPRQMSLILGFSAGVMLYISFAELLYQAIDKVGFVNANLAFFIGVAFIAVLDILIPHEYKQEHVAYSRSTSSITGPAPHSRLMRTGVLIALGIAIHNLPEGLAVFSSAATGDRAFGLLVAVAIGLHNIPEGISVSIPILEATGSRRRAFLYSFSAGLAEPVGALIGFAILVPFMTPTLVYALLAFAAGIMVYISLDEVLPTAHLFGEEHLVILGVVAGMLAMAISILLLR